MPKIEALLIAGISTFALTVPMGVWRVSVPKFSVRWFLAVHLFVPPVFLIRSHLGLGAAYIPLMVLFSVAGHVVGGKLKNAGVARRLVRKYSL